MSGTGDVLIRGMEMPKTGRYFVAVDNTDGKDKIVISVMSEFERGDKTRPLLAVHEAVPVPPHGRLINANARANVQLYNDELEDFQTVNMSIDDLLDSSWIELEDDPTIIPAEEDEE